MLMTYKVPAELAPIAAKKFLKLQGVSSSRFKKIKYSGTFCLNGAPANAALTMLQTGDVVSYDLRGESEFAAEDIPLDVRFEDDFFIVADKPAGMLVHPVRQERTGTLANAVLFHCKKFGGESVFHGVNRLDRNTSGLVLVAKTPEMQHVMSTKSGRKFSREYIAITEGEIFPPTGTIDLPIARVEGVRHAARNDGKEARTHYETLAAKNGLSILRVVLETGRTHQIRVHLSHVGAPILGDELYGKSSALIKRQALHAYRLCFVHPVTGEAVDVRAPIADDMRRVIDEFF